MGAAAQATRAKTPVLRRRAASTAAKASGRGQRFTGRLATLELLRCHRLSSSAMPFTAWSARRTRRALAWPREATPFMQESDTSSARPNQQPDDLGIPRSAALHHRPSCPPTTDPPHHPKRGSGPIPSAQRGSPRRRSRGPSERRSTKGLRLREQLRSRDGPHPSACEVRRVGGFAPPRCARRWPA